MLYNEFEDQCRKLISKIVHATNKQTKAKLSLCLAELRVNYYEQFLTVYPDSSDTYNGTKASGRMRCGFWAGPGTMPLMPVFAFLLQNSRILLLKKEQKSQKIYSFSA